MNQSLEEQIDQLLKEKKFKEARKLIEAEIDKPLTKEEKGELSVNRMMVYLKAKTAINQEYINTVTPLLEELKKLDKEEHSEDNTARIEEIRKKIQEL